MLLVYCPSVFYGQGMHGTDTNWWSGAMVYEITPYLFVDSARYPDIEGKLPELARLGVNTIWLQPVFTTYAGGQGYDITDYYHLRDDLGTETELKSLISSAHRAGLSVIFDFVANHTSIHRPPRRTGWQKAPRRPT